jgi:hypothetical protein
MIHEKVNQTTLAPAHGEVAVESQAALDVGETIRMSSPRYDIAIPARITASGCPSGVECQLCGGQALGFSLSIGLQSCAFNSQ